MSTNQISLDDVNAKNSLEFRRSDKGKTTIQVKSRNQKVLSLDPIHLSLPGIKS